MTPNPIPTRPTSRTHRCEACGTLFTTLDHSDAVCAGFDHAEQDLGEEGGFAVHFDGRGSVPSVSIQLTDEQVTGYHAIRELRRALEVAEALAGRMTGR